MPEIKLPKKAKPSKALSTSLLRPALTRAYIAQPNGHRELIATDSYIIARLPVGDDVPLGALAAEAVKRIEKGEKHDVTGKGAVRFKDKDGTPIEYHAPEQTELPFKDNVPEFDPGNHQVVAVGFNPDLLKNLADALGATHGVKVEIVVTKDGQHAPRAMRVTPLGGSGAEGLLMPVRLNV